VRLLLRLRRSLPRPRDAFDDRARASPSRGPRCRSRSCGSRDRGELPLPRWCRPLPRGGDCDRLRDLDREDLDARRVGPGWPRLSCGLWVLEPPSRSLSRSRRSLPLRCAGGGDEPLPRPARLPTAEPPPPPRPSAVRDDLPAAAAVRASVPLALRVAVTTSESDSQKLATSALGAAGLTARAVAADRKDSPAQQIIVVAQAH
jgi:hypothetical protein